MSRDKYQPGPFEDVHPVAGMIPWICSYDGPDGRYSITLYGSNADQVLKDNCATLPGLVVDGVLKAVARAERPSGEAGPPAA